MKNSTTPGMRFLGVELKRPAAKWWRTLDWAFGCGAAGLLLGLVLQQSVGGRTSAVLGLGAAGVAAGLLVASGANLDAGWRGAALSITVGILAFLAVVALLA